MLLGSRGPQNRAGDAARGVWGEGRADNAAREPASGTAATTDAAHRRQRECMYTQLILSVYYNRLSIMLISFFFFRGFHPSHEATRTARIADPETERVP